MRGSLVFFLEDEVVEAAVLAGVSGATPSSESEDEYSKSSLPTLLLSGNNLCCFSLLPLVFGVFDGGDATFAAALLAALESLELIAKESKNYAESKNNYATAPYCLFFMLEAVALEAVALEAVVLEAVALELQQTTSNRSYYATRVKRISMQQAVTWWHSLHAVVALSVSQ